MLVSSVKSYNAGFKARVAKRVKREDILAYYNNQIDEIKGKRDHLLQLDSFFNSKEVKQELAKLPKEDEILIDCRSMDIGDAHILYSPANEESARKVQSVPVKEGLNIVFYKVKSKGGKLDTDALSKWFGRLIEFFRCESEESISA